jgi:hypothetical protein
MKKLSILILVLAAVAPALIAGDGPYRPTDAERARWTYFDMRSIAICLEAYATDHKAYPVVSDIDALRPLVQPLYVINLPTHDAWGHPYRIESTAKGYRIVSAGSDGTFDESTWSTAAQDLPATADAVYENGKFIRKWSFK